MSKILVVFGATGQQGGSVISTILNDKGLAAQYKIRAITRDKTSASSRALPANVEVVEADPNDPSTLPAAFESAHSVFAMTFPDFADVKNSEIRQGHALVDAAVKAGVSLFIYSTLPNVSKISGGKYNKVAGFDGKAEVEQYMRAQPIKTAFFAPGSFMQNYQSIMKPRPAGDGTYVIARHVSPKTQLPMIETAGDTGKWISAILAEPENFAGKVVAGATRLYTMDEQAEALSQATGKEVKYKQIPVDVYKSFLPEGMADMLIEMMSYQQDFGYYGSETENMVTEGAAAARGELTTFEEYLRKNPIVLD